MFAELVKELESLDAGSLARADAEAALAQSARVRRWLDGLDLRLTARVSACAERDPASKPAEESVAAATRTSPRAARRVVRRAKAAAKLPELSDQLGSGGVSGEHVDVVSQALARLPGERRERFSREYGERIAAEAVRSTPDELRVAVERWVREFDQSDGVDRLASQRRQVGMRTWTDRATGLWRFSGQLDPESGLFVSARLQSTMDALFRERVPDECPSDPEARQAFLRAHALVALTEQPVRAAAGDRAGAATGESPGAAPSAAAASSASSASSTAGSPATAAAGSSSDRSTSTSTSTSTSMCTCGGCSGSVRWRTDAVVIIDERTLFGGWHDESHVDLGGDGVELPLDAIRRVVAMSRVVPVIRGPDGVVVRVGDGRTPLDLGRSSRLASWAQRHALQVMHPTCGVPGCDVPFDHCQPHHIVWWRHGGRTDLRNLLPMCGRHHHLVHDAGWQLHLARDRTVVVTMPDGTRLVGPLVTRWPA